MYHRDNNMEIQDLHPKLSVKAASWDRQLWTRGHTVCVKTPSRSEPVTGGKCDAPVRQTPSRFSRYGFKTGRAPPGRVSRTWGTFAMCPSGSQREAASTLKTCSTRVRKTEPFAGCNVSNKRRATDRNRQDAAAYFRRRASSRARNRQGLAANFEQGRSGPCLEG